MQCYVQRLTRGNLEKIVAGDVRGQLGHGLTPGTAYSEQQGVALGLPQDAADPGDVLDGVEEHDERHRLLRLCVVVREVLVYGGLRGTLSGQRARSATRHRATLYANAKAITETSPHTEASKASRKRAFTIMHRMCDSSSSGRSRAGGDVTSV